jgi:ABC-type transport system involved in multi-copper enzyme maturation permease subunit
MILATARTIVGRKGTFLSTVALAILGVIAVAVIRAIVNSRNPEIHPSIGGAIFVDQAGGLIFFVGVLGGVLVGALAGSYDAAQGTMRYLVMTGVSRLRIYVSRAIALVAAVFAALVPALLLMLVLAVVLPQEEGQGVDGHDLLVTLWSIALFAGTYALVSMGIGSLLHSNGAAITIALLINFALTPALFVIAIWSERWRTSPSPPRSAR